LRFAKRHPRFASDDIGHARFLGGHGGDSK